MEQVALPLQAAAAACIKETKKYAVQRHSLFVELFTAPEKLQLAQYNAQERFSTNLLHFRRTSTL
jgi:hypothetical protein